MVLNINNIFLYNIFLYNIFFFNQLHLNKKQLVFLNLNAFFKFNFKSVEELIKSYNDLIYFNEESNQVEIPTSLLKYLNKIEKKNNIFYLVRPLNFFLKKNFFLNFFFLNFFLNPNKSDNFFKKNEPFFLKKKFAINYEIIFIIHNFFLQKKEFFLEDILIDNYTTESNDFFFEKQVNFFLKKFFLIKRFKTNLTKKPKTNLTNKIIIYHKEGILDWFVHFNEFLYQDMFFFNQTLNKGVPNNNNNFKIFLKKIFLKFFILKNFFYSKKIFSSFRLNSFSNIFLTSFLNKNYLDDFYSYNNINLNKTLIFFNNYSNILNFRNSVKKNIFLKFKNNYVPFFYKYVYYYITSSLEFFLKKRIFLKIFSNTLLDKKYFDRFNVIFFKNKNIQTRIGRGFFLYEMIEILFYTFFYKDLNFLIKWFEKTMYRIQFKNHKKFISSFKFLLKNYSNFFIFENNVKGYFFDIRGKVGVTGDAKKRHFCFNIGKYSKTTKNSRFDYQFTVVRTNTGALGITMYMFY